MNKKQFRLVRFWGYPLILGISLVYGCAPLVVGGGAAGGYKVATDERSAGTMIDDSTITATVNTRMIKSEEVKAIHIDIDTMDGEVILSGFVDSAEEKQKAAEIARSVEGVLGVKNDLQVGTRTVGEALDDKVLGAKIKGKLMGEPGIRSLNIDVDVYLGVASLKGVVDTAEQKEMILGLVRQTEGVKGIIDHIKVK